MLAQTLAASETASSSLVRGDTSETQNRAGCRTTAHVSALGARWAARLATVPGVSEVRGRGLLLGVGLAQGLGPAGEVAEALAREGFIVNAPRPDTIRLAPPLIVSQEETSALTTALTRVLASWQEDW